MRDSKVALQRSHSKARKRENIDGWDLLDDLEWLQWENVGRAPSDCRLQLLLVVVVVVVVLQCGGVTSCLEAEGVQRAT